VNNQEKYLKCDFSIGLESIIEQKQNNQVHGQISSGM